MSADGRRARGERARAALIEATLRVVETEGVAAVAHRRVTREAGLPASSAAYHFESIDDLLEAALLHADASSTAALQAIAAIPDPIRALSEWLVKDFATNRTRCVAEYELFLQAARRPALRTAALRWMTDLAVLVRRWSDDELVVTTVCAYVDGLILQALVLDEAPDADDVAQTIRRLIG